MLDCLNIGSAGRCPFGCIVALPRWISRTQHTQNCPHSLKWQPLWFLCGPTRFFSMWCGGFWSQTNIWRGAKSVYILKCHDYERLGKCTCFPYSGKRIFFRWLCIFLSKLNKASNFLLIRHSVIWIKLFFFKKGGHLNTFNFFSHVIHHVPKSSFRVTVIKSLF